jgi:flagellar hook-basal body complex protein FliE
MIEAVTAMASVLADLQSLASAATAPASTASPPTLDLTGIDDTPALSFSQILQSALGGVDNSIAQAGAAAQAFSSGDQSIPLSDVMVSLEQANLGLQMASGVRDKVVAAYSNIMNMQV